MIARTFLSAAGGIAATTSLLFVMQYLIDSGEEIVVEQRVAYELGLGNVREEENVVTSTAPPKRPDRPKVPPTTTQPPPSAEPGFGLRIPLLPPAPSGFGDSITNIGFGDGPLVNITKVSPSYPKRAEAMGLEGTVLVEFDVTAEGQVVNVVVIESSSPIFEKEAVRAAYRFRYKPRTVDGVAYASRGLRNLFRFEFEN